MHKAGVCVLHGCAHLARGRAAVFHKALFQKRLGRRGIHFDGNLQKALALAAVHCQNAVPRGLFHRLFEIVIFVIHAFGAVLCRLRNEHAPGQVQLSQRGARIRVIADGLGNDIARARQRRLRVGHLLAGITCRKLRGVICRGLLQQALGQRLQPAGLRHAGTRFSLGAVRAVKVLHFGQRLGRSQLSGQFGGPFPLLFNGGAHRFFLGRKLAQIGQLVRQLAQLLVVHAAGGLFAVTRNEGNGVPLVNQANGRLHPRRGKAQFGRNGARKGGSVPGRCGARAGPAYGFRMFCHCCFSFFRLCQKNTAVPAYTAHTPHAERLMALPSAKPGVW